MSASHGLKSEDLRLLKQILVRRNTTLVALTDNLGAAVLTAELREALRQAVAAELCSSGLGPDDEPNGRGIKLERLIDALGKL